MTEKNKDSNHFQEEDLNSMLKIRELWDLINYDISFWIEIAKKKAHEAPEQAVYWNILGDMLWNMSPSIEETLLRVENLMTVIKNNKESTTIKEKNDSFYKEGSQVIMQIALVVKITDTLKTMAKPDKPLSIEDINKLMEAINCPPDSPDFQSPIEIVQNEMHFRGV